MEWIKDAIHEYVVEIIIGLLTGIIGFFVTVWKYIMNLNDRISAVENMSTSRDDILDLKVDSNRNEFIDKFEDMKEDIKRLESRQQSFEEKYDRNNTNIQNKLDNIRDIVISTKNR